MVTTFSPGIMRNENTFEERAENVFLIDNLSWKQSVLVLTSEKKN